MARLILACFCVAALAGCDGAPSRDSSDRYVRRFIPFDSNWLPESVIPDQPQKSPNQIIWEYTETLDEPGPTEQRAAQQWLERCYEAVQRHGWHDIEVGLAQGWSRQNRYHYRNETYMRDDHILDPDRPEYLMYYPKPDGTSGFAGLMFITRDLEERGPQFAGRLTVWHRHIWARPNCVVAGIMTVEVGKADGRCVQGKPEHRSPEMIHTWLLDHPKGPFATSMILPPDTLVAGLEKRMRERGF